MTDPSACSRRFTWSGRQHMTRRHRLSRIGNSSALSWRAAITGQRRFLMKSAILVAALGAALASPAFAEVVKVDGSSTVFPITEAVAEEFQKAKKQSIKVTV